jgi:hypothetical protein
MSKQLHLIGWLQLLAQMLIFKWCHSKALFKIHVYGWGGGYLVSSYLKSSKSFRLLFYKPL